MRRTLALAGAAALAVGFTGLAGPAAADSGITQAGNIAINQVGADLDSASPDHDVDGGFIQLKNLHSSQSFDVSGWRVTGCTTSGSFSVDIPSSTAPIPAGGTYLVADFEFADASVTPDLQFASGEVLEQAAGGAQLQDSTLAEVDEFMWGANDPGVSCAITNAGVLPNDDESINYDASTDTYFLDTPTP